MSAQLKSAKTKKQSAVEGVEKSGLRLVQDNPKPRGKLATQRRIGSRGSHIPTASCILAARRCVATE